MTPLEKELMNIFYNLDEIEATNCSKGAHTLIYRAEKIISKESGLRKRWKNAVDNYKRELEDMKKENKFEGAY
jgi:hypothetical protein